MKSKNIFFIVFALLCVQVNAAIVNQSVKRLVDLSKHIVRIQTDFQFVDQEKDTKKYQFALFKDQSKHLSYVTVKCGKVECEIQPTKVKDAIQYYDVTLAENIPKGQIGIVKVTAFYTHLLVPFPEEITQQEDQFVVYEDSHLVLSPYPTTSQTTKLKLASSRVESFTPIEPVNRKGSSISYGPFENVQALDASAKSLRVHYKNHAPFMTITKLVKEIEVSMWGRVSVEEVYDLLHNGAKLKGGFSRFEYTAQNAKSASFYEMQAYLPKDAMNVYYRDQIGNVSTSRLRKTSSRQELEFKPRFPIFGGWKTQWYLGYSVPTHSVLTRSGDRFKLIMDFSTSIEEANVDELTLKVILPEGSKNIQVNLPFSVDNESNSKRQTYLDTPMYGRPVVIIDKKNVISQHNVPFEVTFEFPQTFMLHEPLLLVFGFLTFFVFTMILFRCDVSLTSSTSIPKNKTE